MQRAWRGFRGPDARWKVVPGLPDAHSIMTHVGISVATHSGLNNTEIKRSVPLSEGDGVLNCTAHNRWVYEMSTGGKNKIGTEPPQAASDPQ